MIISFNIPSQTYEDMTVHDILVNQLSIVQTNSIIVELFPMTLILSKKYSQQTSIWQIFQDWKQSLLRYVF
jgi:hypothetical protein